MESKAGGNCDIQTSWIPPRFEETQAAHPPKDTRRRDVGWRRTKLERSEDHPKCWWV